MQRNYSRCHTVGILLSFLFIFTIPTLLRADSSHSRVINGESANDGDWPFMLGIAFTGDDITVDGLGCGATLINESYAITAAHCVTYPSFVTALEENYSPAQIRIRYGSNSIRELKEIEVADIIVHPEYRISLLGAPLNDIAIIRLAEPITLDPVSLPQQPSNVNETAHILGWGMTTPDWPVLPVLLQEAEVSLKSEENCQDSYGLVYDPGSMLCASGSTEKEEIIDTCAGDSGGPLIQLVNGQWTLMGITSFGFA